MKTNIKKTIKFTVGVCAALSGIAIASVVASSAAVKVVVAGLKAAKDTMKEQLEALNAGATAETPSAATEETDLFADIETDPQANPKN